MKQTPHSLSKHAKIIEYHPPFTAFSQFLEKRSEAYGEKPAIIFDDFTQDTSTEISYQELNTLTAHIAHSLTENFHLTPNQALSFCFPNTPEVILLNYAAWRAGLVTVPLDSKRDTIEKKIYKLQQTEAKIYFTKNTPSAQKENKKIQAALPYLTLIETDSLEDFKEKLHITSLSTAQLPPLKTNTTLDDPALILYTSGTTAMPKGVQLTLKSLFANAESIQDWLSFDENDRWNVILPLHHINSTTFVNTTLLAGGTVILSPTYSKSRFWKTLSQNKATGASIVPTIAYDLLSETSSFQKYQKNLHQVKRFQLGSAPVQPKIVEQLIELYKIPLYQGYGQTETSLRSTGVPNDLSPKQYQHIREINSLGTELKFTNVTVLRADGSEANPDEVGSLCVRGPIIMSGYLKNPQATQESFEHDWFHSGDTGFYQELYGRKFFFLKGRTKEIIKKGGILISPLAIENTLLAHYPTLEKIYVVGFPDLRLGQEIGFVAVSHDQKIVEKILQDGTANTIPNLSQYEHPQAGLIVSESQLPKTATGKIQRLKIKDLFGQKLLEKYRTITENDHFIFRLIGPEETTVLEKALKINNDRWGKNLSTHLEDFKNRAQNAVLIGIFDKKQKIELLGSITALKINKTELEKVNQEDFWTATWEGVTGHSKYTTHNHKGTALLLTAVSVQSKKPQKTKSVDDEKIELPEKITNDEQLINYFKGTEDPVLNFHYTPKAGLETGAEFIQEIPKGRPADTDSLGYSVLVKYPPLVQEPVISSEKSPGTQLVEAALLYAFKQNLKNVFAYSRPAGLKKWVSNHPG